MPMTVCSIRAFIRFLGGGSSVSFSHLQSDFPYTIFTPFRRGVVWNYMKLYSGCLCGKHAEIKNYRHLQSNIEIQDRGNRPRYLISYLHFLLYFRERKLQNNGSISIFPELSSSINFLVGDLLTFYSPFYALLLLQIGAQCAAEAYRSRGRAASSFPAPTKKDALLHIKYSR